MQHSVNTLATVWLATPDPHRKEDRQGLSISDIASDNCHEPKRRQACTPEATAERTAVQHSVNKLSTEWLAAPDPHRKKKDRQGLSISDISGPAMRRSTRGGAEWV